MITEYDRLAERLARTFELRETHIDAGGTTFAITHPRATDDLIDEEAFGRDERLPYWADIWPSARVLADHVARHAGDARSALDLGCGSGLVACALAHAGYRVTVSDYYAEALDVARLNVWRHCAVAAQTLLVDWRALPRSLPKFDVVAAADVLYERPYGPQVAAAVERLIAPGGYAIIADPGRVAFDLFLEEARRLRLTVAEEWNVDLALEGQRHTIRLRVLRQRQAAAP